MMLNIDRDEGDDDDADPSGINAGASSAAVKAQKGPQMRVTQPRVVLHAPDDDGAIDGNVSAFGANVSGDMTLNNDGENGQVGTRIWTGCDVFFLLISSSSTVDDGKCVCYRKMACRRQTRRRQLAIDCLIPCVRSTTTRRHAARARQVKARSRPRKRSDTSSWPAMTAVTQQMIPALTHSLLGRILSCVFSHSHV